MDFYLPAAAFAHDRRFNPSTQPAAAPAPLRARGSVRAMLRAALIDARRQLIQSIRWDDLAVWHTTLHWMVSSIAVTSTAITDRPFSTIQVVIECHCVVL